MRSFLSVAGALSALQLLSVAAQDVIPPCVAECAASARGRFGSFQCTSADDKACLCAKPDFKNDIRDCAVPTCAATPENIDAYFTTDLCLNIAPAPAPESSAPPAPESSAPPAPESSAPPAPESSAPPAPESSAPPPAESSAPPQTTSEPAPTTAPATSSAEESSAPSSATSDATDAEATSSSSTTFSTSTTSTGSSAPTGAGTTDKDKNEKEDDDESSDSGGLSTAAKAGIAVGVIAVVIAILGLILCLIGRKKSQPPKRAPLEISKPLPGSRSGYGPSDDAHYEKYGDIEMTTRYEDMLPRQQPRTMV